MTHDAPAEGTLELKPGARPVPGYELVARLGKGGFGEVWKAAAPGGLQVALKFIPLDQTAGAVEQKALDLMLEVRHAHLLDLHGYWQRHGHLILAMSLADGTLLDRLARARVEGLPGVPAGELLAYLDEAAKGLDFLAGKRMQHRDVKPANLLLVGGSVKVADFGLARVLEHSVTDTKEGGYTLAYAAPELVNKQVSLFVDQYALAVTYCQLRSGRLPFTGSAQQVLIGHLMHAPDLTMLPEPERPAVARALAKKPEERWPGCAEFVAALRRAAATGPQPPGPTSPSGGAWPEAFNAATTPVAVAVTEAETPERPAPARRRRPRPRAWLVLGALALCVTAALLAALGPWTAWRDQPARTEAPGQGDRFTPPTRPPGPGDGLAETKPGPSGPAPLDCTGPGGATRDQAAQAQEAWARHLGLPAVDRVPLGKGLTLELVLVPPGRFLMGSPATELERNEDEAPHEVTLTRPFYLGKYEVTQEQYQAVTGQNPSFFAAGGRGGQFVQGVDTRPFPVEGVSRDNAEQLAARLSAQSGRGFRLPREAEWEYACRGGAPLAKPFGVGDGAALTWREACFDWAFPYGSADAPPGPGRPRPVGSFPPNGFGLCDMHGNVREWCADGYGPYPGGAVTDPRGATGADGVIRGGSWYSKAATCRSAKRSDYRPAYGSGTLGIRLALDLPGG